MGSACNPKLVVIEITLLLMLPVAETDVVKTIVSYSIVGR